MRDSKNSSSSSSSTLLCDSDDRAVAVLREMAKEQSLVTQLRAVVLPALQHAGGDPAEVVAQMFESILDCSAKAIAELKLLRLYRSLVDVAPLPPVAVAVAMDDKRRVRKILGGDGDNAKPNRQQRKRR
jgi:hypothetical protein